jgi:hypothetical protein
VAAVTGHAHVGAADRGHPPREAPPVGVEHGQRPQVRRPPRHGPLHEPVGRVQVRAAVAVHDALGRRRGAGGVVQDHGVPLARWPHPGELRVSRLEKPLVRQGVVGREPRLVGVLDENHAWCGVFRREELERVAD